MPDYFPSTIQAIIGLLFLLMLALAQSKYAFNLHMDPQNRQDGVLKGALEYNLQHNSYEEFMDHFDNSILADGYQYAGEISNPYNALMEVFIRDLDFKLETILLIEAEFFTMDMFLNHHNLFSGFMGEHSGLSKRNWEKKLKTVICVREISAPLQVLLSVQGVGHDQPQYGALLGFDKPQFRGTFSTQVYSMVEKEKKIYAKTFKPDVMMDSVITPWVRKHLLGVDEEDGEMVWQSLDWEDILFLYWQVEELQGAHRYDSLHENNQWFIENLTDMLSTDGYEHLGAITNPYHAAMDVFIQERVMKQETVLLIEVDEFSNSLLLEHRYMLEKFMKEHGFEQKWKEGVLIILCVRRMTPALQVLLSTISGYRKESFYYSKPNSPEVPQVFAVVEEEKKTYTMAYTTGSFQDQMMPWVRRYIIEKEVVLAEEVWKDLSLDDIGKLPMEKAKMAELVR